jgi:rhamnogalacturonyl hydrolase YesR
MTIHRLTKPLRRSIPILAAGIFSITSASADESHFSNWPKGTSPQEIGKRVSERFLASPHPNFSNPSPPHEITYPEVCTWYGALTFAELAKDKPLTDALFARFKPLFSTEAHLVPNPVHVDATVFCALPLELYRQTKEAKFLDLGLPIADRQWEEPPEAKLAKMGPELRDWIGRGLSPQTRLWIDDMYMITMVQTQAFRATGDEKYIDRAASEMVFYLKELQKPNGLFFHAPDVPFYWGRGNGWMAAGMAELLRAMPASHPHRQAIMEGYEKMMATLLDTQGEDGMWRQLLDDPASWPETSCTGMFAFAMITGVKEGWLEEKAYGTAARNAWLALTTYLEPNGDIREVCEGTNKVNNREFYLKRRRITGDMHGQAPVLWCATALVR